MQRHRIAPAAAASQCADLQQHASADDLCIQLFRQRACGQQGTAGGQHVIDQQYTRAAGQRTAFRKPDYRAQYMKWEDSIMTVRGDTFRIRTCGEARDGTGNITARAWCEAVVQRLPEYIDPADEAEKTPDTLGSEANKAFGRRFVITSFRWLDSDEV